MDKVLQVGGHLNTFQLVGSTKIQKTTNQKEAEFYELLQKDKNLQELKTFCPLFYSAVQFQETGKTDYFVTLENILQDFEKPNVLDLKLGSQLFDDDANEEKKQRMLEKSSKTTSGSLGLRIAGMKYYNKETCDKEYGRQLSNEQFITQLLKFVEPVKSRFIKDVVTLKSVLQVIEAKFICTSILLVHEDGQPDSYSFKLIDFAHTTLCPGDGPPKDLLNALNKLIEILNK